MPEAAKTTAAKTTAAAKTTPAKKASKPRTVAPPLDLNTLTVSTATAPVRGGGSEPPAVIVQGLRDSWAEKKPSGKDTFKGAGRKVEVPDANVTQVTNLIRYAAESMGLGSSVKAIPLGGGKTEIRFCAKTRKNTAPKTSTTQ